MSRLPIDDLPDTKAFAPADLVGPLNEVERKNAPDQLFVAGDPALLRRVPRVAIIGSRGALEDGLRRAGRLARLLTQRDAIVVSGLAAGIDTAALEASIAAGGRVVGVIGTPLDEVYPKENAALQLRMMREHLVVSQFPQGHPVSRTNFPRRNRTMALLVHASVIVEAGDTSGALSQGWEALRLGRPLFLMKSLVDRADLSWPREMLDYGAVVLTRPEELLDSLPSHAGGGEARIAL
ncbi:MAG: DNA-processing protein DprA [Myxococcota bacterium]